MGLQNSLQDVRSYFRRRQEGTVKGVLAGYLLPGLLDGLLLPQDASS